MKPYSKENFEHSYIYYPEIPHYGIWRDASSHLNKDVVDGVDRASSIFRNMYIRAFKKVAEIIEGNEQKNKESGRICNACIAFVGGRGSGKSSTMETVAGFLNNIRMSDDKRKRFAETFPDVDIICKHDFYTLDSIEVTQMTTNTTILGTISAQLHDIVKDDDCISRDKKRAFYESARRVNKYAVISQLGSWQREDNDNLLNEISMMNNMKKMVHDMMTAFLDTMSLRKDSYVVIQIDDLDMSISNLNSIMKEIYTYLTIPNVIVLISVCEDQLSNVLKSNYQGEFQKCCTSTDYEILSKNLANHYIAKVIPTDRKIMMPNLGDGEIKNIELRTEEDIIKKNGNVTFVNTTDYQNDEADSENNSQAYILSMVHRKTMLVLYEPPYHKQHDLIPTNLRELNNFYYFLKSMEDVYKSGESIPTDTMIKNDIKLCGRIYSNLDSLGCYIHDHYFDFINFNRDTISTSNDKLIEVLKRVIDEFFECDVKHMNSHIIVNILSAVKDLNDSYVNDFFVCNETKPMAEEKLPYIYSLLNQAHHPDIYSVGDVLYVLGELDHKVGNNTIRYLIEIIRILWSIRMTMEYYSDELRDDEGRKNYSDFRYSIGGFIANPDNWKIEGFNGWLKMSLSKNDIDELFSQKQQMIISHYISWSTNESDAFYHRNIRTKNSEPYFMSRISTYEKENELIYYRFHPLSIYSNMLDRAGDRYNRFATEDNSNMLPESFMDPILALPLYSLDFLTEFYYHLKDGLGIKIKQVNSEKYGKLVVIQKDIYSVAKLFSWLDTDNGQYLKKMMNGFKEYEEYLNRLIDDDTFIVLPDVEGNCKNEVHLFCKLINRDLNDKSNLDVNVLSKVQIELKEIIEKPENTGKSFKICKDMFKSIPDTDTYDMPSEFLNVFYDAVSMAVDHMRK